MTVATTSPRAPLWHADAETAESVTPDMLSITEVAELTGLKAATIQVAVNSTAHVGARSRLRSLARPHWIVDGVPYWSRKQVGEYHAAVSNAWDVRAEYAGLPTVTRAEAVEGELTSLHGLQRVSNVPIGTLHRWKTADGFPLPAARMDVGSPTPRLLYHWPTVREHMRSQHETWLIKHPDATLNGRVTDGNL